MGVRRISVYRRPPPGRGWTHGRAVACRHLGYPSGARGAPGQTRLERATALLPGLAPVAVLAAAATVLGHLVPVVGAPVFAVLGGIGMALVRPPAERARPGLSFAAKTVLKASIVVLGTGLSFHEVLTIGGSSLPVLLGTLAVALVGAVALGRVLGVARDLRTLIGVGTGICGASAIAATDAVISASEADVSYAIATIFTFNVAAVLTFPTIGHALGLSPHAFGLWAGTAVNDLSSVVAASTIFGHGAATYAGGGEADPNAHDHPDRPRPVGLAQERGAPARNHRRTGSDKGTAPRRAGVHRMVPRRRGPEHGRSGADQLASDPVGDSRGHDHDGTGCHRPLHSATRHPPCGLPAPGPRRHLVGPGGRDQLGSSGAHRHSRVTEHPPL